MWSRVSFCVLSLTLVLGAVGCGSSGFNGQSDSSLTMTFQGFTGEGLVQQDFVGNTSADVDVCQSICSIGGDLVDVTFETFTSTRAFAQFVNNGTADIILDKYVVSIPGTAIPPRTVQTAAIIQAGRCSNSPTTHCGLDNQCGFGNTCVQTVTDIEVLLYDFTTKELVRGDQKCPRLDPIDLVVIPGDVTPITYQTNVTFYGSDESGNGFNFRTGLVADFFDANNCNTNGAGGG
jgi:hypothetical protein